MMNYEGLSEDNQHKEEYAKETPEELIEKAGIADVFDDTVSIDVYWQNKKNRGKDNSCRPFRGPPQRGDKSP
jgi:hypothetical protein